MDKNYFKNKRVLVMGLGKFGGGADSVLFAYNLGAKVIVTDLSSEDQLTESLESLNECQGIEYHLGGHIEEDFKEADIVIVNPAVPPNNKFVQAARDTGKLITSQIEIFFQLCPAQIVGVTGANGKSTTTALTGHLLEAGIGQKDICFNNVWLGGNIGNKPLLSRLDEISERDTVVLELSSFQLEQLAQIKTAPHISVITNLTPNHLDRHGTFEAYCDAKENIFRYQSMPAVSIFNAEDEICCQWYRCYNMEQDRKCYLFSADDVPESLIRIFKLPGRMNLSNLSAALAVARHLNVNDKRIEKAVESFKALKHRLELVAEIDGVRWYDDSIATTPISAIEALKAFNEPKIIIAGGYDKNIPFEDFGKEIAGRAKAAILIGQTAGKICEAISEANGTAEVEVIKADTLANAVTSARKLALNGDIVLLSPACASYDMFSNFKQRGEMFQKLVLEGNQ